MLFRSEQSADPTHARRRTHPPGRERCCAMLLQQTACNGRPISTGTMDHHRLILGNFVDPFFQMIERDVHAPCDHSTRLAFLLAPDIEYQGSILFSKQFTQRRRGHAFDDLHQFGRMIESRHARLQIAGDVVKPDPSQTHHRFFLSLFIGDDDDRSLVVEHRARPRGVLALQSNVNGPFQVAAIKLDPFADIDDLRFPGSATAERLRAKVPAVTSASSLRDSHVPDGS